MAYFVRSKPHWLLVMFAVFHILGKAVSVETEKLAMDLWLPDDRSTDPQGWESAHQKPTYTKTFTVPPDQPMNYPELIKIANKHYNWVNQEGRNCIYQNNGKDTACLVAAFFTPEDRKVVLSTVPRPERKRYMGWKNELAPRWWSIAGESANKDKWVKNKWHAEESAWYEFEKRRSKNKRGDTFANGSLMAVWGRYNSKEKSEGRDVELCKEEKETNCQFIARHLNVEYRGGFQFYDEFGMTRAQEEDVIMGENDLGLTSSQEEDLVEDYVARYGTVGLEGLPTLASRLFTNRPIPTKTVPSSTFFTTSKSSTRAPTSTTAAPSTTLHGTVAIHAGSSHVHVGTLTGDPLYTSVSSALESLCPPVTQTTEATVCSTGTADISGIEYVQEQDALSDGKIVVTVESSSYNSTDLRNAMIQSAAMSAKGGATGRNCYEKKWETSKPSRIKKRAFGDSPLSHPLHEQEVSANFCNTVGFTGVYYYGPYWQSKAADATDWIDMHLAFEHPPESNFDCEVIKEAIDLFALIVPQFSVADIELGQAIDFVCETSEQQGEK